MRFIRLKHIHIAKLVKVEEDFTYHDYVELARKKFPELKDGDINFMGKDGTILEEDILVDFINESLERGTVDILLAKVHDNIMDHSIQSCSTISITSPVKKWLDNTDVVFLSSPSPSVSSDHSNTKEVEVHVNLTNTITHAEIFSPEQWKRIIIDKGGGEIFDIYNDEGLLPNSIRMKLVQITCAKLVETHGFKIPEFAKRNLAEAIISLFPNLKDPMGQYGYEAFYTNNNGGEGYIAWRLRTICRTQNKDQMRKRRNKEIPKPTCSKKPNVVKTPEIETAIEFLKNASNSADLDAVRSKLILTYPYRKSLGTNVLEEFPRFLDNPGLIEEDYIQEHCKINFEELFHKDIGKILLIYEKSVKNPNRAITNESVSVPGWDRSTRALLALIEMLPPTPKVRNTGKNHCPLEEKLIVFKAANTTISEILLKRKTSQPFVIAQGSNKAAITQYNIIVDQKSIPCPYLCSSAKAFEIMFMSYFVFDIKYDEELKIFYEFMQKYYFKIASDKLTPKIIESRTRMEMFNSNTRDELNC